MTRATRRFDTSVALVTLLLAMVTLGLSAPRMARAQGWLDPAWQYRRAVTVANPGATALTDYQVRITLDASFDFARALSDGSDLRVTASDGTTLLPHWKETWNPAGSQGLLWTRLPAIPAEGTTVYLYYGNAAAGGTSDGTATFALFDDDWASSGNLNPVHTAGQPWWEATVSYPIVFEDNSFPERPRFHMLYDGHALIGNAKGYATSSDLAHWTEYDNGLTGTDRINPIMGPGYTGNAQFAWGDVIKRDGVYHMFPSRGPGQIVHTQSTDLLHWSGFETLTGMGTGAAVLKEADGITPVVVDGKYWMIYFPSGSPGSVYLASADASSDLLTWDTCCGATPILTPTAGTWDAGGLWTPSFVQVGDTYYIYYEGNSTTYGWAMGFAKGAALSGGLPVRPDNVSWSKSPLPVVTANHGWDAGGCADPTLREFDGTYYLFYSRAAGPYSNGFCTSSSPEGPWIQYGQTGTGVTWIRGGSPATTGGVLTLPSGSWVTSPDTYSPGLAVGFRARYDNGPGTVRWGGFISGTAWPGLLVEATTPTPMAYGLYLLTYDGSFHGVSLGTPPGDFHVYEDAWVSPTLGRVFVDNATTPAGSLTVAVPSAPLPVSFRNHNDVVNPFAVDWMYLRSYAEPEPVASVGAEQGPAGPDTVAAAPAGGTAITLQHPCVTVPIVVRRANPTPLLGYSVTIQLSANLTLCGSGIVSAGYPLAPRSFEITPGSGNRWTVDEVTLGTPCGATGDGTLFTVEVASPDASGTGTITVESVLSRDCANDPVPVVAGPSASIPIDQVVVGVVEPPLRTQLAPPRPTPFSSSAALEFSLAVSGPVELAVFGVDGRRVRTLVQGSQEAGVHRLAWNGRDDAGHALPAGMYFLRLAAGEQRFTRTLVRLAR